MDHFFPTFYSDIIIFSSPDPKGHVSYCHHWASVVVRPSVNFSHFNQLLWSHWANLNQTLVEWSLDGPLPKLCPVIPTSIQDGHQAKNRKKGEWNFNCSLFKMSSNFNCSYMARSSLTYIPGFSVKFFFQPIYTDDANWASIHKRSHLNLLLWNRWTKLNQTSGRDGPWVGPFQNCVRQPRPPFKMAVVAKKIEISTIIHCCFNINQNELKFYLQLHGKE